MSLHAAAKYGPDIATEADLRLLGEVKGKRVLDLGCGDGQASVAFAHQGATAIGVDLSATQLAQARQLADREEVRVEWRHGDMADLAFLRADSIDAAFSAYAFDYVEDLGRVFRQVHRVLKAGAPLAFSLGHPLWTAAGRSYFDPTPVGHRLAEVGSRDPGLREVNPLEYPRTFAELYSALVRASYRVDAFFEPQPAAHAPRSPAWRPAMMSMPRTLVVRARKEGR